MPHQILRRLRAKLLSRDTHTTLIIIAGPSPAAPPPTRNPSHVVRTKAQRNAPPEDLSQKLHALSQTQRAERETYVVDYEKPDDKPDGVHELFSSDEKSGAEGVTPEEGGETEALPKYEEKGYYDVDHVRFCKSRPALESEDGPMRTARLLNCMHAMVHPVKFDEMMEERLDMELWIRGVGAQKVEKRKRSGDWLSKVVCCGG